MSPPITIKKRSVKLKPNAAQASKPAEPQEPTEAEENTTAGDEENDAPVFVSKPQPTGRSANIASSTAMSVAAVFALIATLILLFVILLQWTELRELLQLFPQGLAIITPHNLLPW